MALWQADDYGVMADRVCWSLFGVTLCKLTRLFSRQSMPANHPPVVVILRLVSRSLAHSTRRGLGVDDYITVVCVLVTLVSCILVTIGSHHGLGRHMRDLSPADQVQALKWNVIISSVLIWSFSLPKFAIIAILKRILDYGLRTTMLFWGLALSSQACILATSVWWYTQCAPVERGWDMTVEGECADIGVLANLGYFTSAYSAFLDIFFALYPIPFIMRLNMPLKARLAVSCALGLSILACIVSIYKLAIFGSVFEVLARDPTYPVPFLDILGIAEGCILIICASLPTLGPLYRRAQGSLSTVDRSGANSQKTGRTSQGQSSVEGSGRWASSYKGHKLHDPEPGLSGSVDDIPLVSQESEIRRPVEFGGCR